MIRGSLDLLDRTPDRSPGDRVALARMHATVKDMQALLETVLLLARGHELRPPEDPVSVNRLVEDCVGQLAPLATRHETRVEITHSASLPVLAPAEVLAIVIGNLLRNAINYTARGTISIQIDEGGVTIRDTGAGMNDAELKRAFEPFYRGDQGRRSGDSSGQGLGLAIVERLAEQFGWLVTIASKPGKGTQVAIRLRDVGSGVKASR